MQEPKNEGSPFWMQTYSKGRYDFYYNNPEDVNIVDIAHSLAQLPRFNGHLNFQYSVAQHSLMVLAVMEKDGYRGEVLKQALMHDVHEAYIGDWSRPFKKFLKHVHGVDIDKIELPIKKAISERFGVDIVDLPKAVHDYDDYILRTEAEDLFDRVVDNWTKDIDERCKDHLTKKHVLPFATAKMLFIKQYNRLGIGGQKNG